MKLKRDLRRLDVFQCVGTSHRKLPVADFYSLRYMLQPNSRRRCLVGGKKKRRNQSSLGPSLSLKMLYPNNPAARCAKIAIASLRNIMRMGMEIVPKPTVAGLEIAEVVDRKASKLPATAAAATPAVLVSAARISAPTVSSAKSVTGATYAAVLVSGARSSAPTVSSAKSVTGTTAAVLVSSAGSSAPTVSSAKFAVNPICRKYTEFKPPVNIVVQAPVPAATGEDGWTKVTRRKAKKPKSSSSNASLFVTPRSVEYVTELEYEWYPKTGPLRWVRKWSQLRKGGYIATKEGSAVLIYWCPLV